MRRVPNIIEARPITRVTFYQWLALERCAFKGLFGALVLDGSLPDPIPTKASLIGTFYHRAMELAFTMEASAEVEEILETEIKKLQSVVSLWPHLRRGGSVSGWDEINRSFALALQLVSNRHAAGRVGTQMIERELSSADGLLVGRPDYFSITGNRAMLREYKSVRIRDAGGELNRDYLNQLRFYSALIVDTYDVAKIDARIESLSGDSFEMMISPKEAKEFAAQVATTVASVNRNAGDGRELGLLATPSKGNCTFCESRILCAPFKRDQDGLGLEGEDFLLEGVVVKYDLDSDLNVAAVTIADDYRKSHVTLVVPANVSEIGPGLRRVFVNVRSHGVGFAWGHTSRVLSYG